MLARTLATLFALASSAAAQTQWLVDADSNGDTASLQQAIDWAAPGDQIWITPGSYAAASIDKSLTVRATTTVQRPWIASLEVDGADDIGLWGLGVGELDLRSLAGEALVDDCEVDELEAEDCERLFVQGCQVSSGTVLLGATLAVLRDSSLSGCVSCTADCDGRPGLRVQDDVQVWVERCSLIGGDGAAPVFGLAEGAGLEAHDRTRVTVTGGPGDLLETGSCPGADGPADESVRASDQAVVRISGMQLRGTIQVGAEAFVELEAPDRPTLEVTRSEDFLEPWTVDLAGPEGTPGLLFAAVSAPPIPVPELGGVVWGQPNGAVLLAALVLQGSEPLSLEFPNPQLFGPAAAGFAVQFSSQVARPLALESIRGDTFPQPPLSASVGRQGVGDINGDGLDDLVVSVGTSVGDGIEELRWLANPGVPNGTWIETKFQGGVIADPLGSNQYVVVDLDGDGDQDIVGLYEAILETFNGSIRLVWWRNLDGLGTFAPPLGIDNYPGNGELVGDFLIARDFDGDGDADVLVERQGLPELNMPRTLYYENAGLGQFEDAGQTPISPFIESADAADIDGDGDLDLLLGDEGLPATSGPTVWIQENLGGNLFASPEALEVGALSAGTIPIARDVRFADIDADGHVDALAMLAAELLPLDFPEVAPDFKLVWYRGMGPGLGFDTAPRVIFEGIDTPRFALSDLDGDGDLDVSTITARFGRVRQFLQGASADNWTLRELSAPQGELELRGLTTLREGPGLPEPAVVSGAALWRVDDTNPEVVPRLTSAFLLRSNAGLDCDGDGVSDALAIARGSVSDLDHNGLPDGCQSDCDGDGIADGVELELGLDFDCNGNGVPDQCDLLTGTSVDVDGNGVPDECEPDCDGDGVFDALELLLGTAFDVDGNGIPDDCELDCDGDGLPDAFEIATGLEPDCNRNGIPDSCDIAAGTSADVGSDGIPDECQSDCDGDGTPDTIELAQGTQFDCDMDGVADDCAISAGLVLDCNGNGVPDSCDLAGGFSQDVNSNGIPDDCEPDCDGNGLPDAWEIQIGTQTDADLDGQPDECTLGAFDFEGGAMGWELQGLWQLNPDQACGSVTQTLGFNRWPAACDFDVPDPSGTATSPAFAVPGSGNLEVQFDGRLDGGTDFILITQVFLVSATTGDTVGLIPVDPPVANDGQQKTHVGQITGLDALAGQQVRLQYSFSVLFGPHQGAGWQIDNVRIAGI